MKNFLKEASLPTVHYQNTPVVVEKESSVLEALEGKNFRIPFSCRAGVCHSCMMQVDESDDGDVHQALLNDNGFLLSQQGLSANQVAQGYFLPCCCYPSKDMDVKDKDATEVKQGRVSSKKSLSDSVLALSLEVDFRWFPGQYITLWHDAFQGRSYSIASRHDHNKTIELHIKRHDLGLVSRWVHDDLHEGDNIKLSSPLGNCFYTDEHNDKPLLMACTGTGLAPLYGILLEALAQQHTAPIYLYAAGGDPSHLYYQDELMALAKEHPNVHYIRTVRREAEDGMLEDDVVNLIKERHPKLNGWKIFLCGGPTMIKTLQRQCFFNGASISDILVDAFEMVIPEQL